MGTVREESVCEGKTVATDDDSGMVLVQVNKKGFDVL